MYVQVLLNNEPSKFVEVHVLVNVLHCNIHTTYFFILQLWTAGKIYWFFFLFCWLLCLHVEKYSHQLGPNIYNPSLLRWRFCDRDVRSKSVWVSEWVERPFVTVAICVCWCSIFFSRFVKVILTPQCTNDIHSFWHFLTPPLPESPNFPRSLHPFSVAQG